MKKIKLLCCVSLSLSVMAQSAWAWKETGHQEVVAIAWANLDPATRTSVQNLLASQQIVPKTIGLTGEAAWIASVTWPDELRQGKGVPMLPAPTTEEEWLARSRSGESTPVWHYVNRDVDKPYDGQPTIGLLEDALPIQIRHLGDKTLSMEDRAMALVWVSHLVGDSHQPMHTAARADAKTPGTLDNGGNKVIVQDPEIPVSPPPAKPLTLHRWWDQLPGNATPNTTEFNSNVARLTTQSMAVTNEQLAQGPSQWIRESFNIAKEKAYPGLVPVQGQPGVFSITQAYRSQSREIADDRVALAGRRLADIVTQALK